MSAKRDITTVQENAYNVIHLVELVQGLMPMIVNHAMKRKY